MPSQRMFITSALLLGACCISVYPVSPESESAQGLQTSRNLNQALSAPREGVSHDQKAAHSKGNKGTLQEDVPDHLVEDLDAVLWKMVAVGELQSQGFTQTDQALQQPSKRAWKHCVSK